MSARAAEPCSPGRRSSLPRRRPPAASAIDAMASGTALRAKFHQAETPGRLAAIGTELNLRMRADFCQTLQQPGGQIIAPWWALAERDAKSERRTPAAGSPGARDSRKSARSVPASASGASTKDRATNCPAATAPLISFRAVPASPKTPRCPAPLSAPWRSTGKGRKIEQTRAAAPQNHRQIRHRQRQHHGGQVRQAGIRRGDLDLLAANLLALSERHPALRKHARRERAFGSCA